MVLRVLVVILLSATFGSFTAGRDDEERRAGFTKRLTISFKDESTSTALRRVCDAAGVDYVIGPALERLAEDAKITAEFVGTPFREVYEFIARAIGRRYVRLNVSD